MKTTFRTLAWLAVVVCTAFMPRPASAERYAALVGVSNYAAFPADSPMQLQGPRNDVPMIRSLLEQRGFQADHIRVLADQVAGGQVPTRAAILDTLDHLVKLAKRGDFVFLYFAGHGSRVPAESTAKGGKSSVDGWREIFLPSDVGPWEAGTRQVRNAIADDELVVRLDQFLAKDVFVWAVFDACHSATLMRSTGDPQIRYRHVDPLLLGVPGAPSESPTASDAVPAMARVQAQRTRGTGAEATGPGGYVAFYAAQTTQTTPEMRLPAGSPDRKPYGLFSYSLAEALSTVDGASYRQLAQFVLGRYGAQNINSPTPLFTGSHLDAPVFGSQRQSAVRQWPLGIDSDGATLPAGQLSQLTVGTELDILPNPLSNEADALGTLRVVSVDAMRSQLGPSAQPGRPTVDLSKLPRQAVARLTQPVRPTFQLRVFPPPAASGADVQLVRREIEALQKDPAAGMAVQWVQAGQAHDLRLVVEDGLLWQVPPTGQLYKAGGQRAPSIRIHQPEFRDKLVENLHKMGRAQNLLRIASALQATSAASNLQVTGTLASKAGDPRPVEAVSAMPATTGDALELIVRNVGRTAIDLTALYIDAENGITALFPEPAGSSNRLEPNAVATVKAQINTDPSGLERLLLIGVEAKSQQAHYDFSYLAQARVERMRSATAPADDIVGMFDDAGLGDDPRSRGAKLVASPDRTALRVFTFQVK